VPRESRKAADQQAENHTTRQVLPDGVIEEYDQDCILRKVTVPDDASWRRNGMALGVGALGMGLTMQGFDTGGKLYLDGEHRPHREDGPAVEYSYGRKAYWVHGERHRDDGPALIDPVGEVEAYWVHGRLHREDGPASIDAEGVEYWVDGELHREGGPAMISKDGSSWAWYSHGKLHRSPIDDGSKAEPTMIDAEGSKHWIVDGGYQRAAGPAGENLPSLERADGLNLYVVGDQLHRDDGPAVENLFDSKTNQYWLNGEQYENVAGYDQALAELKASRNKML